MASSSKVKKAQSVLVRHVNPKFVHYDRPFLLAVLVGALSLIAFALILYFTITEATTVPVAEYGGDKSQVKFIAGQRAAGAVMCIDSASVLATFQSDVGLQVLQEIPCMPGAGFFSPWPASDLTWLPSTLVAFAEEGLQWCGAEAFQTPPVYTDAAGCEALNGSPCPPCDPLPQGQSGIPPKFKNTVFKLVYQKTTWPKPTHAIGVSLAFTAHVDVLASFIVVLCLMACKQVFQVGPHGKEGLWDAVKDRAKAEAESAAEAVAAQAVNTE